ncbi:unnamed protein product [Leptosia nina]|uniref:Coiled-coil domain-containing protein 86 n=1 Tax=Leptosia nina TaxID=320188 RepID=A0AAV1IWL1_9NEOP
MDTKNNTEVKVLSILNEIKSNNTEDVPEVTKNTSGVAKQLNKKKKGNEIRGIPKSGRFWKSKKERFNSIVKTKGIRLGFEKKKVLCSELQKTKELSRQIVAQAQEREQARKERRRENLKRAEENKKKSEIVQVITNTKKLKRMKKKQLRFIEKRDTNKAL